MSPSVRPSVLSVLGVSLQAENSSANLFQTSSGSDAVQKTPVYIYSIPVRAFMGVQCMYMFNSRLQVWLPAGTCTSFRVMKPSSEPPPGDQTRPKTIRLPLSARDEDRRRAAPLQLRVWGSEPSFHISLPAARFIGVRLHPGNVPEAGSPFWEIPRS